MAANDSVFEVGLAMAGAISAGAYSAGVMDFLFQALEEWERLKREAPATVPNHSICIRAAAGASAGSITAALGAVAVAGGLQKEAFAVPQPGRQHYRCVLPALHKAWVTMPDMASPTGAPDLLSNSDLDDGAAPRSLLNAEILESLADEALRLPGPQGGARTAPAYGGDGLPYVARRLHLYLMLSNIRGVPYRVDFTTGGAETGHYMMSHGDRAHYVIENIGKHEGENEWLLGDPGISLRIDTAPQVGAELDPAWRTYGLTAIASAAFPVGLAARPIESSTAMYEKRSWPGPQTTGSGFSPSWPPDWSSGRVFRFMSVDGGLIDNEPFEYARRAIMPKGRDNNDRNATTATGAVLLVDPFPEPPAFSADDDLDSSIVAVARALLPMLKNQARFKPDELAAVLDKDCSSRWMVAPSRSKAAGGDERYAIATGVLGGFGGFLDESFRAHDYQLGRRNCQQFLKEVFVVGDDNPIAYNAATKSIKWPAALFHDPRFRKSMRDGKHYCPVIPVVGDAEPEVALPAWPRIDASRLAEIERRVAARVDYVVPRLLASTGMSSWKRWALRLLWTTAGKAPLLKFVQASIASDLIRRDQMTDWSALSDNARAVLAELTAPGFDYRTINGANGICRATYLNEAEVRDALGQLRNARRDFIWSGQVGNQECWTLTTRRPGWFARNNPLGGEPSIG